MNINKILLVIKREYVERVRSRWFLIGTLIGPLMMSALIVVPIMIARMTSPNRTVAIVDTINDSPLAAAIEKELKESSDRGTFKVERQSAADKAAFTTLQKQLANDIESGKLNGYLVVGPQSVSEGKIDYFTKNAADIGLARQLEDAANNAIVARRLSQAGMDAAKVAQLSKRVDLKVNKLVGDGSQEEKGQSFILSFTLMMILYMTLLFYGAAVLRGVIEEKQSRIVEVIISSISPSDLMIGKVVGIGLVGLTQFIIWGISAAVLPTVLGAMAVSAGASIPDLPITVIIYFVAYFVLGYFLYSTLFAMAGSIVSNEQDAQQVQLPVTMLLVIPVIVSSMVIRDPNGTASVIFSLVPFFSPVLMFLRISMQTPPNWQVALSLALMILTTFGCSWLAGKIYRVGILMYGKRPTLPELVKWLRYT
ncbi:MAG: ABC transporter permease [Acidobacteriota bacterium]